MTREGPMDGNPERRIEALETAQRETGTALDRLLELSVATNAKLAALDAKLDAKVNAADIEKKFAAIDMKLAVMDAKLAIMDAKLDAKATATDLASVSAKLDAKASTADVAKYEPLAKAVADLVIDNRIIRDNARSDYRVLFGAVITAVLSLAALMAKGFHWL